jgi:hypothetical protein
MLQTSGLLADVGVEPGSHDRGVQAAATGEKERKAKKKRERRPRSCSLFFSFLFTLVNRTAGSCSCRVGRR